MKAEKIRDNMNAIVNFGSYKKKNGDNVWTINFTGYYTISDNKTFRISCSELV